MKVKDALEWELNYIDKRFNGIRLKSAKEIVKKDYEERRRYLLQCLKLYQ